jgi:hypothetical protein
VYGPVGILILVLVAIFWAAPISQDIARISNETTRWVVIVVTGALWLSAILLSTGFWAYEMEGLRAQIDKMYDKGQDLKTWYDTYCACFNVITDKIVVNEVSSLITYVDKGVAVLIPAVYGTALVFSAIILVTLMTSIHHKNAHMIRMLAISFMFVIYACGLGATVTADLFVYGKNAIESSGNEITQFLASDVACTAGTWSSPSVPDTTSCPRDDTDHDSDCFYGDTYFTQLLQPVHICCGVGWGLHNTNNVVWYRSDPVW